MSAPNDNVTAAIESLASARGAERECDGAYATVAYFLGKAIVAALLDIAAAIRENKS